MIITTTSPRQSSAQAALTVEVITPRIQVLTQTQRASGHIAAKQLATINSQLQGVNLQEILVDIGDRVSAGTLVAKFDDAAVKQQLIQARAGLHQAELNLKLNDNNAQRGANLLRDNAISRRDAEQLTTAKLSAQAALEMATAELKLQQLRLSYTQVKAPVAGIISEKKAIIGQTAAIGMPLLTLIVDGKLEWHAQVDSDLLTQLHKNMAVSVALDDANNVAGTISNIAPTVDVKTRQGTVYVSLADNPLARAGAFVEGSFLIGSREGLTIPASAMTIEDGYYYVWLLDDNSRVKKQRVTVLLRSGDIVMVDNLTADAKIVARGGGFLVDGDEVKVIDTIIDNLP